MTNVFRNSEPVAIVGDDWLPKLKDAAQRAELRRSRLCLHHDDQAGVHEMVIAFCQDSLVRPHRHRTKSESFHLIEGRLDVVLFDDQGAVVRRIPMGPPGSGLPFLYRIDAPLWHTVILRSETVVMHETTAGPFVPGDADFAPWAPAGGPELAAWIATLAEG